MTPAPALAPKYGLEKRERKTERSARSSSFVCQPVAVSMQWTQYELAADSWQELQTADPTMLPASTRVAPAGPCQLQLDGQALVVQPELGTDLSVASNEAG